MGKNLPMALGRSPVQQRFENPREILGDRLREGSIYRLLADHGLTLFRDDYFADLYSDSSRGQPTIPARLMATVMLLQAYEGLSDAEATDRLGFDLRWQAACGVDTGYVAFHPTSLVGQRNRLRASERPRRTFEDTKVAAKSSGAMKTRARVFDSTPIYDAVATQDTVTQLRAVIRKLLGVLERTGAVELATRVRAALSRDDDYSTLGKPPCDWDDRQAREQLVDELVRDCLATLSVLEGENLTGARRDAADLVALVAGQDTEQGDDGVFRIAKKVAKDRVISTVDPEARHGHKSKARKFDGFKVHVSLDPDSELLDEVLVTPANTPDKNAVPDLVESLEDDEEPPGLVGDCAYGDGATRAELKDAGFTIMAKVPPVKNMTGGFSKDRFIIDLQAKSVTCPQGRSVPIRLMHDGSGTAHFAPHCSSCPLAAGCTRSKHGRTVTINSHEELIQQARAEQADPKWKARYKQDRPKVERKISHFVRRPWGGRKARTRGLKRVATDIDMRAGAINLARLAVFGLSFGSDGWHIAGT